MFGLDEALICTLHSFAVYHLGAHPVLERIPAASVTVRRGGSGCCRRVHLSGVAIICCLRCILSLVGGGCGDRLLVGQVALLLGPPHLVEHLPCVIVHLVLIEAVAQV